MNWEKLHRVYFVGIGGIGMSAIARYFNTMGKDVYGYDRAESDITRALSKDGISLNYTDDEKQIPPVVKNNPESSLIVYTPAISEKNKQIAYFRQHSFEIQKRSAVLGIITKNQNTIAIAGTHGKTSVTTMVSWLLSQSIGCNAFLGGISKNFDSNYHIDVNSELYVVEADEFDRSFLQLTPTTALITSMDADHLDIYNNKDNLEKSFFDFTNKIVEQGTLIIHKKINEKLNRRENINTYTYSLTEEADFYAKNLHLENGSYYFDLVHPKGEIINLTLSYPGLINVENAIAALACALTNNADANDIKSALKTFTGVKRRFDIQIKKGKTIYIDDYAHHPEELKAFISSVRALYPGKKISGVFQPHLYSRTRDFASEFAESLDLLDEVILLDVYPARELPIPGVTSEIILSAVKTNNKTLINKNHLTEYLRNKDLEVLLTMGAGDIDRLKPEIKQMIEDKNEQGR